MYNPLHVHSDYSLLDGLSKPHQIAQRCVNIGVNTCAITDHGSISGAVSFIKACKAACKCSHQKGIHSKSGRCQMTGCNCQQFEGYPLKPILGCEFYLTDQPAAIKDKTNRKLAHLVVLAKNLEGWKGLIKATGEANKHEHMYYKKPRLQLEELAKYANGNWVTFSGHMGSQLANVLFVDLKLAYGAKSVDEARGYLKDNYKQLAADLARHYQDLFGKENFFLEIQRIDHKNLPASVVVADVLAAASIELGIAKVATPDAHYPTREDAPDQRVELAIALKTTLGSIQRRLDNEEDVTLGAFFRSNSYHIPSLEEMESLHTKDELQSSLLISEMCDKYDILGDPKVPAYPCPNGLTSDEYLRELCRKGWVNKIAHKVPKDRQPEYVERVKHELGVIASTKILADYFLIVQDYMNWARNNMLCGKGRGSGSGSLVSHLLNITDVDPIEHGLLFERFYNAGRNTATRISFPDIDCDFPISRRADVKAYIKQMIGPDKVAEMLTFNRMQGRSALKDVIRVHEACSQDEANAMTEFIPDESEINDQLQIMREATGEASIIQWALQNESEGLHKWCFINEQGELEGPYAKIFEQAIRLEGTKHSAGKHAGGVIVSSAPLAECCPMVYDENTKQLKAGMEMNDMEAMGYIKFDILGVAMLDKAQGVQQLLKTGRLCPPSFSSSVWSDLDV